MIPAAAISLTHFVPIKIALTIAAMVWCDEHFAASHWIIAGYVGDGADAMSVWAFAEPHEAFAFKIAFG